jgi:hypothetical protein
VAKKIFMGTPEPLPRIVRFLCNGVASGATRRQ